MKKILGISLVALMSVTAANAAIPSKQYVDDAVSAEATTRANAISGLDTRITTNASDISALDTRMDTAEGKITTAETNIGNLQTAVDNLGGSEAGTVAQQIQNALHSEGQSLQPAFVEGTTVYGALNGLEGRMDSVENGVSTNATAISTETSARESADAALDTRVTANKNAIDAINNATTGIAAVAAADATSKVNALATGAVANNTSAINAMTTSAGTAETGVAVLTRVSDGQGGYTYNWESIDRTYSE